MLEKALSGSCFPWCFFLCSSRWMCLYITNSLFPTVYNFVGQCAAEAEFVVLHWNNTSSCLHVCIVEAGLIYIYDPVKFFLTTLSLSFCLFLDRGLHLESCTEPEYFPKAGDAVFHHFQATTAQNG